MNKFLLTVVFCFLFSSIFAQMSAGFSLGCMNYQGDFTYSFADVREINVGYGLYVTKRYANPKIALKGILQTGTITGNDINFPERWVRNLQFSSQVTYVGVGVEYLPKAKKLYDEKGKFVPQKNFFVSTGFGMTFCSPQVVGLDEKAPDKTVEVSKKMLTLPLTVGMRFDLDPKWSVSVEGSYFIPFTDYLDGISVAGSTKNTDKYLYVGVSIAKKWGDIKEDKVIKGKKTVKKAVKKKKKRR